MSETKHYAAKIRSDDWWRKCGLCSLH